MPSSPAINAFNRDYLHAIGSDGRHNRDRLFAQIGVQPGPSGNYSTVQLTDAQRRQMKALLQAEGRLPRGADIDTAGNANEPEGFKKELKKWGPIAGGAALTAFGIPGVFPGVFSGAGAAAGAAASATKAAGGLLPAYGASPAVLAAGTGAGGSMAAGGGFWSSLGKFLGSPGGAMAIGAGGNIAGNWLAARGANRAADAKLEANREALDWEKDLYNTAQTRLSDLVAPPLVRPTAESTFAAGQLPAGGARLSDLSRSSPVIDLSRQREGVSGTNPVREGLREGDAPTLSGLSGPPAVAGGGGLVRVQAPDGEIRELPVQQAAQAIRLGARRVA